MKSQSTSEEIELDQIQIEEEELVPVVATRIHKVFSNNPDVIKKRKFIDLTEVEACHKPMKKSNSQKKSDPFEKLGEEANQRVLQLMKEYETKFKVSVSKTPLAEYNETVKEQFCKYLLFGLQ